MALPKLDNTQIEKNQQVIIQKMDGLNAVLSDKLVPAIEKMTAESTVDKMFPFVVQIADNIYNIAGKLEAQVTSMKEVRDALEASKPKVDEGAAIEAAREKEKKAGGEPRKEEKKKSFLDRLGELFDKILIPLIFGFVIGLSKALGGFESTIGRVITIFAALYLALSGFRKKVNELVVSGFKKLFGKPAAAPGAPPQVPGAPTKPGVPGQAPGAPGAPDMKPGKPGKPPPSGLDKFLEGAKKVGKSIKELFVGIADTIKQVLGKLADGIKTFISKVSQGIKVLLQNIAKGIESFGKTSVLKGAAALLVVSGAIYVAAKAFEVFTKVSWEDLAKAGVAILGLTAAVAGIGTIAPLLITGSVALGAMSAAFLVFAGAVNLLSKGLPALSDFLTQVSTLDGGSLLSAANGITAIGVAIAALGAGQVIGALGNFASSILSFGKEDIFTKLTKLGEVAGDLNQLPATIEALGKLSNFKVSNDFAKNVDTLAAGLKKIAESAKGFEKTGDSLTALAKIAEVMNKPAQGGAPAGAQPGGAPGKPVAGQPQPAPGKPTTQVQAAPQQYSSEDIAKAEKQLEIAEKSGNKAAASQARSRLSNMKQQNKIAEATAQATPEQRKAVAEGKPVPVAATQGQQITSDSQKVAAAQGGGGSAGGPTNIVAPTSSVVNAPQSQTINAPLSAYGIFGGRVSNAQGSAAF